jgi:hypothetical protein
MPFGEPLAKGLLMKVLWQSDQHATAETGLCTLLT